MVKLTSSDLLRIYLLPTNDNLVKGGVIFYLLGVTCTFLYFAQFNIISFDYLKPNAIVLGIYQWIYFILLPRSILLLISYLNIIQKSRFKSFSLFALLLITSTLIFLFLFKTLTLSSVSLTVFLTLLILCFHLSFTKWELTLCPSIFKTYIFSIFFCTFFSYFIFPKIPYELGGGKPIKVAAICSDTSLLSSRYSKNIYLLYAADNDYYFIEKKQDSNTNLVYGYTVKKVNKSEIKKIEFSKSIWQPF